MRHWIKVCLGYVGMSEFTETLDSVLWKLLGTCLSYKVYLFFTIQNNYFLYLNYY